MAKSMSEAVLTSARLVSMHRYEALEAELEDAQKVIAFYADPETYFAIGFLPDSPCGEFINDIDDTGEPYGFRAGKRARAYLNKQESDNDKS